MTTVAVVAAAETAEGAAAETAEGSAVDRAADIEVAAGTTDNRDSAALHVPFRSPVDIFLCCYSSQISLLNLEN